MLVVTCQKYNTIWKRKTTAHEQFHGTEKYEEHACNIDDRKKKRTQIFKSTNIQEHKYSRGQKSANMLQCGSKYKYFGEKQYEIGKVCRKRRKTILSLQALLAKIYVRIWDANRRN